MTTLLLLDVKDPIGIKCSKSSSQLSDDCAVLRGRFESLKIEVLVSSYIANHENRLDIGEVSRIILNGRSSSIGLTAEIKSTIYILEVETVIPDTGNRTRPAGIDGVSLDDIPVILDD